MIHFGQRLREERIRLGLSLEEVAAATKIRASFLSAIEKGEYKKLPSSAYVQGFVKNYIDYLGLSQKQYFALFKREFDEKEYVRVLPQGLVQQEDILITKIRFGYTLIGIVCVVVFLLGYIGYQYRYAFIQPPLEVYSPKEESHVNQFITVSGKTDPNMAVSVNKIPVVVDKNGLFNKNITLFLGKSTIEVLATSRFGKKTQIERHVQVGNER